MGTEEKSFIAASIQTYIEQEQKQMKAKNKKR